MTQRTSNLLLLLAAALALMVVLGGAKARAGEVWLTDSVGPEVAAVLNLTTVDALAVGLVDSNGDQITTFAGTEYTEGATDTTITGTAIMWEDASDTLRAVSASKPLPISDAAGSLTVDYATTGSGTATGALRVELPTNGTGVIATVSAVTAITNALPAGENHVGQVGSNGDCIETTFSLDTSAYADGDVLADTQTITNAVRVVGGRGYLQTLTVIDEDDQGIAFDIVLLNASNSLGTENSAPNIADAEGRTIIGRVPVASADFYDFGAFRKANLNSLGLMVESTGATRDLYIGAISRGAGTYTAAGIRVISCFIWD